MKNISLVTDYMMRAGHRLAAVELLLTRKSYADVVRESQELVELCLKALLRHSKIEVPRTHDVADLLIEHRARLPKALQAQVEQLAKISRSLRRDRELAFYGSEDLTPSDFYKEEDAQEAFESARWVHSTLSSIVR